MQRQGKDIYQIGSGFSFEHKYLYFNNGNDNMPGLRYNMVLQCMEYSDDGIVWRKLIYRAPLIFEQQGNGNPAEHYLQGYVWLHKMGINDAIDTVIWEVALDDGLGNFTQHSNLASLQNWIDTNITGDCITGTRFLLRALPEAKKNRKNETRYIRLYLSENF